MRNEELTATAKLFGRLCLLAIAGFVCISAVFAQAVDDKNEVFEVFKKFSGVNAVESDFVMKKYVSISETPLESSGKFYFKKPALLNWEYIKPFSYGFTIDKGKTISWQENNGKRETKDISSQGFAKALSQQLYAFISMDKEIISKTYDIKIFDEGIILQPKNKGERQLVEDIKIYFSKTIPAADKVVIQNKNGDKTEIIFKNTKTKEE